MSENYKLTIMKELSVVEKAKRYDEAIKRASNLHKDAVEMENNITTKTCEIIFPELKESEDERTRENLYKCLRYYVPNDIAEEYIEWLEKQGEQKQIWKPNAAQLIVIKSLIEDKNTLNVSKVILRGMLDEFKQYFGL